MAEQPREFKNMQGLLKFCIESTKDEDVPKTADLEAMSNEKRQWLEEALYSMTEDTVQLMKTCCEILQKGGDSEEALQNQETALNQLLERCDNIDHASDFYKIGGYSLLVPLLTCSHASLRRQTAHLIAELCQNNPFCQEKAMEFNILSVLVELLDRDIDKDVRIKALYAISCLTRDNDSMLEIFIKCDGFSVLLRAIQDDIEKLKIKAAFMLRALCSHYPKVKDLLCDMGYVEQLISLIHRDHEPSHEYLVNAILELITDHPRSIKECHRPELHLKETLIRRIELLKNKEEFQEELNYCQSILNLCFSKIQQSENMEMDR